MITKIIQRVKETGGKGISCSVSLSPLGAWRKMESKTNSPVVIVMVLMIARPGVENGERCRGMDNSHMISAFHSGTTMDYEKYTQSLTLLLSTYCNPRLKKGHVECQTEGNDQEEGQHDCPQESVEYVDKHQHIDPS